MLCLLYDKIATQAGGQVGLEELRSLAGAACGIWRIPPPDPQEVAEAFSRHRRDADPGLILEGFVSCASEWVTRLLESRPQLELPDIVDVLAAYRHMADRLLLHCQLPLRNFALRAMGVVGVCVELSKIWGLAGGGGALEQNETVYCRVVVQRCGRILPRRACRSTACLARSDRGRLGEPVWHFAEDLMFDDPTLLYRRGDLHASLLVKRSASTLQCALAVVNRIPVPTPGFVELPLIDAVTGNVQGGVRLRVGWPCSDGLADFLSQRLLQMRDGCWAEARAELRRYSDDAMEYIAGHPDHHGRTMLMAAALHEDGTALVRDMLALRTPFWFKADSSGASAAHYAAFGGSLECLAALLGSGLASDVPATGLARATPLMLALLSCRTEHAALLIGHGARVDRLDEYGLPAAAWALHGSGLRDKVQRFLSGQRAEALLPSDFDAAGCPERGPSGVGMWGRAEFSLLALLVAEVWRSSPPLDMQSGAALPALARVWLPWAGMVAERAPEHVLMRFSDELRAQCRCERLHRVLLHLMFKEAVSRRREIVATRLVSELGALSREDAAAAAASSDAAGAEPSATGGVSAGSPRATAREADAALDAAAELQMPGLACALLSGGLAQLGSPARVVKLLRLSTEEGDATLAKEVLQRLPDELVRDPWKEPVVVSSPGPVLDCPVCLQPISARTPVALGCVSGGTRFSPACPHFVCRACSDQVNSRCPLCRTGFSDVQPMPDVGAAPLGWFHFAARCDAIVDDGDDADPLGQSMAFSRTNTGNSSRVGHFGPWYWLPEDDGDCSTTAASQNPFRRSVASGDSARHMGRAAAEGGGGGGGATASVSLSREDVERILPVALAVNPQVLSSALDGGLWDEWDGDGDGRISTADFFEPRRGLLRWVLVHTYAERALAKDTSSPDLATHRKQWFQQQLDRLPRQEDGSPQLGLRRGDVLCAMLRLACIPSLDTDAVERFRRWVDTHWLEWDAGGNGFVVSDAFLRKGGLADALLEQASLTRAQRTIATLRGAGDAGEQAEALAFLCSFVVRLARAPDLVGAVGDLTVFTAPTVAQVIACARRCFGDDWSEPERLAYAEAPALALAALVRHPRHAQVVGWACRFLTLTLLVGRSKCDLELPSTGGAMSWPEFVAAVRGVGYGCLPGIDGAAPVAVGAIRAIVSLSMQPRGTGDSVFLGAASSVAVLLWLLDSVSEAEAGVPRLLCDLKLQNAMPVLRGFACGMAALLLCDVGGVSACLRAWGHDTTPMWSPVSALSPAQVRLGQQVEVCTNGAWMRGIVDREPMPEASNARDECWIVSCQTKVFSRHLWAPGWRLEAARAIERVRLAALAALTVRAVPRAPRVGASAVRRSLLEGVLVHGLLPKAMSPPLLPQGPVLKGASNIPIRAGDKVSLNITVEAARSLNSERRGDWNDQMVFCLDCPGRVVETLTGPARARVSHGSFGTFIWNPAAITSAESSPEPLAFEEQHGPLVVGDEVLLCMSQEKVVPRQCGHGGWSPRMALCLGRYGRVGNINNRGDIRVDMPGCGSFLWNSSVIESPGKGCVATLCAQALAKLDDEGAAILLLLTLAETQSDEAVRDIVDVLEGCGPPPLDVPVGLRAYGALALLAAVLDIRAAVVSLPQPGSMPPPYPSVRLPLFLPASSLEALSATPAMRWQPQDTGGISFKDVVQGKVDAIEAAQRWALAFFGSRHRRLLNPGGKKGAGGA